MFTSPIILTGRGGSGTRLLSDVAAASGVFTGNELNDSSDSVEWTDLIYDMLLDKLSKHDGSVQADRWEQPLMSKAREVIGQGNWTHGQLWGWKLPESVMVLPELFEIFPAAKLIHLVRHPVASSLRRTHLTSRANNPVGKAVLAAAYEAHDRDPLLIPGDAAYLHNAITWNFQVGRATQFTRSAVSKDQYLEIRYEDFCVNPRSVVSSIQMFLGVPSRDVFLPEINVARMKSFQSSDTRIGEVWELCKHTAVELGYEQHLTSAPLGAR